MQNMQTTTTTTTTATTPVTPWKYMNGVNSFAYDTLFDTIYIGHILNDAMNCYFATINFL